MSENNVEDAYDKKIKTLLVNALEKVLDYDSHLDLIDGDTYFYLQGIHDNLRVELEEE